MVGLLVSGLIKMLWKNLKSSSKKTATTSNPVDLTQSKLVSNQDRKMSTVKSTM